MADENKALNLDELFGQSHPIKVKWQDKEYELLRLEAFSPTEVNGFMRMQKTTERMRQENNTASDADIVALFDGMLGMLCKDLPLDILPFLAKVRIITFYIEETQGKKNMEAVLSQAIGATPSQN